MTNQTASTPPAELILLKLGEVVLKGLNRRGFEERLIGNAKRRLKKHGTFQVTSRQSIVYVEPLSDSCDMDGAYDTLCKLFGVVGVSRAKACEKTPEAIFAAAADYLRDDLMAASTFKVESKRSDKAFPMNSIQLSQYVGGELDERFPHLKPDMHDPDVVVHCEVRDFAAYVHANPAPGAGGLPVGMGGRAVSLLSGGIDSPVASWMMAKRGVALEMVHFFSYPYTEIQEELRRSCPEPLFTLLMRRFMMRISERVARRIGAHGLVTGESLGQVASQTMDAMAVTNAVVDLPVFRPVVGMDKEEIIRIARNIGTFETSILPYEDCCTVFTPRHPKTHPTREELEEAETKLDVEGLIRKAVDGIERVVMEP